MIHGTTTTAATRDHRSAVQEAVRVLQMTTTVWRWVCEVCGMMHSGSALSACDSCGVDGALVAESNFNREMGSRR